MCSTSAVFHLVMDVSIPVLNSVLTHCLSGSHVACAKSYRSGVFSLGHVIGNMDSFSFPDFEEI